ncbi:hypothetical protein ZIOFF_045960 [Zingiber officinale]|uniref:Protein groES n=1 Tax=Zingiber officinale TaxID=94328 RepID=A0A8J5G468_ZINOF|nr:hypothetical protein ZIOFF_045960 [Zingiber officinale]
MAPADRRCGDDDLRLGQSLCFAWKKSKMAFSVAGFSTRLEARARCLSSFGREVRAPPVLQLHVSSRRTWGGWMLGLARNTADACPFEPKVFPSRSPSPLLLVFISMARRLIPSLNRVLVEKIVPPSKNSSGILLPEKTNQLNSGKVIAVGAGARDRDGKLIPVTVKEGDTVLLPEYGGTEVKLGDKEYAYLTSMICLLYSYLHCEESRQKF